jgi:MoxR-like ATPase
MALIYNRLRAGLPTIIMGETGIGKTIIVKLLSHIMNAKFYIFNVHSGIKRLEIIKFI